MTFALLRPRIHRAESVCFVLRNKSDERKGETKNLFALLSAVVGLVPGLVESAGLARALRDLMLLEVFTANA